jgi:riboflavin biosynthesis pyrimidine reductase
MRRTYSATVGDVEPMRLLFEANRGEGCLTPRLAELYGGDLALADDLVFANFVTSLDGVAALPPPQRSAQLLSGRNPADRFLLGLLRALADVVIVGAGTLRAEPRHLWTAAYVSPGLTTAFAELRRPDPSLVIVSARGELDPGARSLELGALVLTTDEGASRLAHRLPTASRVRSLGAGPPSGTAILEAARAEGHRRLLTEGGPTLLGHFLADQVLDELFLTLSPLVAGRSSGDGRLSLVEGIELLPGTGGWAALLSVRVHGSHLFLRYGFKRSGEE